MPIAIKMVKINGELRVPPKCMKILLGLAEHRDECLDCTIAYTNKKPFEDYCIVGQNFLRELSLQPEVERVTKTSE